MATSSNYKSESILRQYVLSQVWPPELGTLGSIPTKVDCVKLELLWTCGSWVCDNTVDHINKSCECIVLWCYNELLEFKHWLIPGLVSSNWIPKWICQIMVYIKLWEIMWSFKQLLLTKKRHKFYNFSVIHGNVESCSNPEWKHVTDILLQWDSYFKVMTQFVSPDRKSWERKETRNTTTS